MTPYNPDRFNSTYETKNGEEIWAFLNEHDNIIRMETATYLARPAVEPLSPKLKAKFGDDITEDRVKQMIGHMVRQIMEKRGYHHDQNAVRISRALNIFTRASRYAPNKEDGKTE
uniref:hypothetical protein n=1 Tax=Pararhizobium sp. IMCC3301 TaxID=3067904 RepID=UPI0027425C67|nr:hypothetical protein [Pararhizobium sp. IMCC3301]